MPQLVAPVIAAGSLGEVEQPRMSEADLLLRPWVPADAPWIVDAFRDPAIRHWHTRAVDSIGEAEELIEPQFLVVRHRIPSAVLAPFDGQRGVVWSRPQGRFHLRRHQAQRGATHRRVARPSSARLGQPNLERLTAAITM